MNRNHIRYLVALVASCVVVSALYAGGWAVITLNQLPDHAVAGKPINLAFAVRQHGITLMTGLQPTVRATSASGLVATAAAVPAKGEYTAVLTLPQPGDWTITITSGFNSTALTLPALKVTSSGSPAPIPLPETARGERLFVSKGCTGCHLHSEITPERTAFARIDLTGKRFPQDYLQKFLANPSIKPAEMPNLHLKENEIAALAAFINTAGGQGGKPAKLAGQEQ